MTTEQIIALAQAGGLILLSAALLTGQVWAKPSVDFLRAMLTESLSRETKLADALAANTATMQEAIKELRERKGGVR
jgi:hypothetical protein